MNAVVQIGCCSALATIVTHQLCLSWDVSRGLCKLTLKSPEEEEEKKETRKQEMTASLAVAKEFSTNAAVVEVAVVLF